MGHLMLKESDLNVSWDKLHRDGRILARRLMEKMPLTGVVAVPRGGLAPAGIIARELGIRRIETFSVASYDGQDQGEANVLTRPGQAIEDHGRGWLVIDDLVDTGDTARLARSLLPQAVFATIYAKPKGRPVVDVFVEEVPQDCWIFFPWDLDLRPAPPISGKAD